MINHKRQRVLNPLPFILLLYVILQTIFILIRKELIVSLYPIITPQSALRYSQSSLLAQSEQQPVPSY